MLAEAIRRQKDILRSKSGQQRRPVPIERQAPRAGSVSIDSISVEIAESRQSSLATFAA